MGAGRTELMKILYGAAPRKAGTVSLDGRDVVTHSPQDGLANGIVYISEDRKRDGLVLGMSVKENMSLTALRYFSRADGSLKQADERQAVGISSACSISKRRRWSSRSACFPAATSKSGDRPRPDDPAESADPR